MKNEEKTRISLAFLSLLTLIIIILLHIYFIDGTQKHVWLSFLAILIFLMLLHNVKVTALKTDLELEVRKNKESHELLVIKYGIESTLSQISSFFAFSDDLDENIRKSLALLGELCNADRAYVFKLQSNPEFIDNTHEWCADGVEPQKDKLQDIPIAMYSWWTAKMQNDEIINIEDINDLPDEADAEKKLLESQDIKSLIVLSFKIEGEFAGFIGFDNVKETGEWDKNDIATLNTFANIIGMAFKKKSVMEELDQEREQLLSVFDSMGDPIYVSDPHTHEILFVNKFLNEILDEDPIGKKCYEALQRCEKPCDFCTNPIILENKDKAHQWEYHNPVTGRDYIVSDRIINWPDGRDVRLEIAHDITDIKEAEIALKEKEERFKKIVDNSPLPMAIMNYDGRFEYVNDKLTETLGYTIEEIPTIKEWWEAAYPDIEQRNSVCNNWEQVFNNKETGSAGELNIACKDGAQKQIAFYFTKINNNIIFILNDQTDLKRTEEALLLDESCLETLHELSQMNVFSIDEIKSFALKEGIKLTNSKIGIIGFFNDQDKKLIADTYPDNLLLLNDLDEETFCTILESTNLWPRVVEMKKPIICNEPKDNINFQDSVLRKKLSIDSYLIVPILNEDEIAGFAAVANKEKEYTVADARQLALITQMMGGMILLKQSENELKSYNKKLRDINDELHSLDELKNNFLSTMNHELKTPLISIMGFSELVGDETLGPLNKEQKKAMNVVNSNSGQLKRLIESLLFMSSLQAKNYSYDLNSLRINPIIENALSVISVENTDKKLNIENTLPEELYFVNGDSNYLSELFFHLIDNAFKFTPSGGRISIDGYNEENDIHIVIEDSGIGIPETKIMKTFDSFHQLDGSLSRKYGGTGIGLNICKRIVEDHGGKLWIESMEGVGTKVHITLPALKDPVSS